MRKKRFTSGNDCVIIMYRERRNFEEGNYIAQYLLLRAGYGRLSMYIGGNEE